MVKEVNFAFKNSKICTCSECYSFMLSSCKNFPFFKCSPGDELFTVVLKPNFEGPCNPKEDVISK